MNEVWRDVVGFEGFYQVSSLGNIFSIRTKKLVKIKTEKNRYKRIHFWVDGKVSYHLVHKLVCEAFIGKRPDGLDINHIDGDRGNNSLDNLEYITRSENVRITFIGKKRGAYKDKSGYRARIFYNGKHHHIKTTKTKEEAYEAYYEEYIRIYNQKPW